MKGETLIKASLLVLHVLLVVFAVAVLHGREAPIIGEMFSSTLWAIILNLSVISGNKGLQRFVELKWGGENKDNDDDGNSDKPR